MGHKLNGCRNGRQCACGAGLPTAGARARSAASGRAGCAASCPAIPARINRRADPRQSTGKGGDELTVSISAALILGAGVFLLCRYAGLKILHAAVCVTSDSISRHPASRRTSRTSRQACSGSSDRETPERQQKESRTSEHTSDVSRAHGRAGHEKGRLLTRPRLKEVVPYDHHARQPAAHPPTPDRPRRDRFRDHHRTRPSPGLPNARHPFPA